MRYHKKKLLKFKLTKNFHRLLCNNDLILGVRDSWTMITLKRRDGKIPDWFDCKHVARFNGKAVIEHIRAN